MTVGESEEWAVIRKGQEVSCSGGSRAHTIVIFTEGNKASEGRGSFVTFVSFCSNPDYISSLR
jgi:hypothetical protein